jgi:coenzyme F420-0:L-glutamate ligase/coenzyme F420-1:gamma-L-glutamate ligase
VVDSRVTALRLGTVGLAIGLAGFIPIRDDRSKLDLYGRKIRVTQLNLADDLAATAHMLMGERNERVGAVLIRGAPIKLNDSKNSARQAKLRPQRCLITNSILHAQG